MSTFVLVHGSWHGAWCWDKVVPLLEQAGHKVEAIDLPGHGNDRSSIAEMTMQSYVDRVCQVIDAQPEPVILVGHSMAGVVISQTAEYRSEKIQTLVYLAAFLLQDGEFLLQVAQTDTESLVLPNLILNEEAGYHMVREEARREVFYHDCSDEDAERACSQLVPEANAVIATPIHITRENYGRVPRVYIETLSDKTVGPSLQTRLYTATPCLKVITLNTSHSPFFSAPEELVKQLNSVASMNKETHDITM
ncbi:MAG: alpha/beta fold hydrolase [Ktedonobacteraceae bacterium]